MKWNLNDGLLFLVTIIIIIILWCYIIWINYRSRRDHDPLRIDRPMRPPAPPTSIGRGDLDPFGFDPSGRGGN